MLLSVQYEWGGEVYDQEFRPGQVRYVGSKETIEDLLRAGRAEDYPTQQRSTAASLTNTVSSFTASVTSTVMGLGEHLAHMRGGPIKPSPPASKRKEEVASASPLSPSVGRYRPALPAQGLGENLHPSSPKAGSPKAKKPLASFTWPDWALQYNEPSIEVCVEDPQTRITRWVAAMPKNRVVGAHGEDG